MKLVFRLIKHTLKAIVNGSTTLIYSATIGFTIEVLLHISIAEELHISVAKDAHFYR